MFEFDRRPACKIEKGPGSTSMQYLLLLYMSSNVWYDHISWLSRAQWLTWSLSIVSNSDDHLGWLAPHWKVCFHSHVQKVHQLELHCVWHTIMLQSLSAIFECTFANLVSAYRIATKRLQHVVWEWLLVGVVIVIMNTPLMWNVREMSLQQ